MQEYIHILPVDDEIEHSTSLGCWCQPTVEEVFVETLLVVHHSADGRELLDDEALPPAVRH